MKNSVPAAKSVNPIERRQHHVYVTRNNEYHVRRGVCVAVMRKGTMVPILGHAATMQNVRGSIRFREGRLGLGGPQPQEGDSLCFFAGGRDLVTSTIERVARPSKAQIKAYPHA